MQTRMRDVNMKRKNICRLLIVMLASIGLCACGKEGKKEEVKEQISQIFAVRDEVVKSEKEIVIEDEKVATAEQNKDYKMYENELVQFSYPKAWILTEKIEEDGMKVTLKDGEREVFSLDQGEYALVDMDATEEDYYRKYQEKYPYLDIVGIEEITIDECEARKLTFIYRKEDIDYTGVKYMVAMDDTAMIFYSELPTKIIAEYEKQIVSICESVILKEADKAELEQMIYFEKQEYACDKELITEKIDTESLYLYGVCELGEGTVQVYRNIQDYLVIAAVDQNGEHTVLACETDEAYLTYESLLKGKEVSTWMTMQEDLFGYPTVLIQVLVGASATDYFVIGEVDGSCQVLFHECESGLKIGDVDGDGVKELISSLDGYFYRYEGGRVCKYKAVWPDTIKQLVWEGNFFSLYLSDGVKKKGELVVQESGVWCLAEKDYMSIQVFEQDEVEIVPNLELYSLEQASELGIVTQQQGQLPGFGVWYTVEIDGVVYHYGHYENQTQEQAQLCSYAIVKDTYALANGISVGMTEEDILAKYPNMAVMNFQNEYLYEVVTGHQGWNGIAYPCITQEENGVYMRQCWLDQFDYVMIGDINLKTEDTVPIYLGLLMKDGKVGAITKYNPTAG